MNILSTIRARFYFARTRVKYVNSDEKKIMRCAKLNYSKPESERKRQE